MTQFIRLLVFLTLLVGPALTLAVVTQGPAVAHPALVPMRYGCSIPVVASRFSYGGLTYNSSFQIQNPAEEAAGVTITFYDQSGAVLDAATVNDILPSNGSWTYFAEESPGLPTSFLGSAFITSDQRIGVGAMANLAANGNALGASSSGYIEGGTELNLPLIMRGNSGYYTWFAVQNVGNSIATVGVTFTAGSAGIGYTAPDVSIYPGASHVWFQPDMPQLGSRFIGSAKVVSRNYGVPLVATVVEVGPSTLYAYDGLAATSTTFVAPLFQYHNAGFSSSIQVQNAGTEATTVSVRYTPSTRGHSCVETRDIPAGAAATFGLVAFASSIPESDCYAQNPGTAFIGSATTEVNSSGQPLVAIVNQHNFSTGKGAAYSAFRPEYGLNLVSAPLVMDRNSNYWTGITVFNVGAPTTVGIDYSGTSADTTFSLGTYESKVVLNQGAIASQYVGSALVFGANPSDKLLVVVNEQNLASGGDSFYVYTGSSDPWRESPPPIPTPTPTPPPEPGELFYDDGSYDGWHKLHAAAVRFSLSESRQLRQLRYYLRDTSQPVQVVVYDANWNVLYSAPVTPGGAGLRWYYHDLNPGLALGPGDFYVAMIWPSAGARPHLGEDTTPPHTGRSYGSWESASPPFGLLDNPPLDLMIRVVVQ